MTLNKKSQFFRLIARLLVAPFLIAIGVALGIFGVIWNYLKNRREKEMKR